MKILITGARGNFPTALIPLLAADDHKLILFDMEPMNAPEGSRSVQGDLRDAGALVHAMHGCDAVIHAGGYHGNASGSRNEDDFYSVNVTGTHNVLRAMLLHEIHNLVFSSSEVVYGDGLQGHRTLKETTPCIPTSLHAMTKLLGEEMCRFYARKHHFQIAMLRYGCFVPADWKTAGLGQLANWVDRRDVAMANYLALGGVLAEAFTCEAFLIHSATPFSEQDWPDLETQPDKVVERYYPGATALLKSHGLRIPQIHHRQDITKAVTLLGYDPQYNFDQFLSEMKHT